MYALATGANLISSVAFTLFILACTLAIWMQWRSGKGKRRASRAPLPPGVVRFLAFGDETQTFLSQCSSSHSPDQWYDERVARYGSKVFKVRLFGNPTVVLLGAEANKFVLSQDHTVFEGSWPKSLKMLLGYNSVSTTLGKQHHRVYRGLEHFFGTSALKRFMIPMQKNILRKLKDWEGRRGEVAMSEDLEQLAYDTVLEISMGIKDSLNQEKLRNLFKVQSLGLVSVPIALPWTVFGKAWAAHKKIHKIIGEDIRKRRVEGARTGIRYSSSNIEQANDVMDLLMFWEFEAVDSGEEAAVSPQLSDVEVSENAAVLVEGGGSSLGASLASLIHILSFHPEVVMQVRNECKLVADTKEPGELLSWNDVKKLEYTRKVVMESLRIRTTIPTLTKKAKMDVVYDGFRIPKGWTVLLAQRQTHNKEEYWPEPNKFNPNRFDERTAPFSFLTFGGGPRKCVAEKYVILNMQLFLYHFVLRYDWNLVNPAEEFVMYFTLRPKQGLLLKLKQV